MVTTREYTMVNTLSRPHDTTAPRNTIEWVANNHGPLPSVQFKANDHSIRYQTKTVTDKAVSAIISC